MKARALLFYALLALTCASSYAQNALATLTGAITDSHGAAIPNVSVSARHIDTGTIISGASSNTGIYTLTQMPIGKYDITVDHMGFKNYKREGVTLSAAQVLRLDIPLEIGTNTETVTVNADASMLKTDTSAVTHNITVEQMQNLPLIPVTTGFIRDPLMLAQLLPGVRYSGQTTIAPCMSVNGMPCDQVQYRIEGQVMGNARTGFTGITTNVQPSVDSIQEVAIQTSNYAAEFGSAGGALFNFTMKSGSNQYHGSGYDYMVNEVLNANNPGTHTRNKIRRHDWGATFGGPINIPKLYNGANKSFFFFAWEMYNQTSVNSTALAPTVPTQSYRDGDYSGLTALSGSRNLTLGTGNPCTSPNTFPLQTGCVQDYVDPLGNKILAGTMFDPNSYQFVTCNNAVSAFCSQGAQVAYRTALPGNRLPVTQFDPVSAAILKKYIPLPAGPNSGSVINNYLHPFSNDRLSIIPSIKLDHNFSAKTRASFFYQRTQSTAPYSLGGEGFNDTITAAVGTFETQNRYTLNVDHTITPTLQFHLGGGWTQFDWSNASPTINYNPLQDIGLKGIRQNRNFPSFGVNTTTTAAFVGLGGMNGMGPGAFGQALNPERRPSGTVSLTWIKGNHSVKYGTDWRFDMLPTVTYTDTAGNFAALGGGITSQPSLQGLTLSGNANTGFAFANFMLGSVGGFNMRTPITYRTSKQQWGMYLQDTWRKTRKMTLDYGLRWDYGTYAKEDYGRNAALSLTTPNPSAAGRPGALIYEATCKCKFAQNYPYAIGPRVGVAYNWNPRTVFRAGFGVSYGSTATFGGFANNNATAPAIVGGSGLDNFKLHDGVPATINPQWPIFDAGLGQTAGTVVGAQSLLDPNAGRPSRTYQWNVSIQREINRNLVVEASYVANRGVWQSAGAMVDFNAMSVQQLGRYGFSVGNLDDAALLNTTLAALTTAQKGVLTQRGVSLPYSNFPTTQTVLQSLRSFPQYAGAISPTNAPLGKSWYDSLQLTVNKRYSHGLQLNMNYTWSKNLSQTAPVDVFNRDTGKNLAGLNLPQQIRINFEYQIQKFRPDTPVLGNKWVNQAIAGWGIAGVLRYYSGGYLGRPAAGSTNLVSRWLGRGPGGAQLKQNADGSYMSPWSVDWTDNSGKHRTDPLDINCHCFDPEKTLVFNPNAWQAVPDATWAADTSQLPFFRGQRTPAESANLSRNFRFGKDNRYTFQVRVEFQQVMNRTVLNVPTIGGAAFTGVPVKTADGRYSSGFGTFGNLRATYGNPRSGMFVGRFTF